MRASIEKVGKMIKSNGIPSRISQQPFDHDPGHYQRLCKIQDGRPNNSDLVDYALDMQYMELQPELLRHLTPILLAAWRRDLFEGDAAGYGGFVEHFWPALLKGAAFREVFTEPERGIFVEYLRESILDRLDAEDSLQFSGMGASPYRWIESFVSFGVLFPDIEPLWNEWWRSTTEGHAISVFQYASALLYPADKNPVFAPWTPEKGGGPPALWECGCHFFDIGWKEENIAFLRNMLSVNFFKEHLPMAMERITIGPVKDIASSIVQDLPQTETLLGLRIEELPKLLTNVSAVEGFTL